MQSCTPPILATGIFKVSASRHALLAMEERIGSVALVVGVPLGLMALYGAIADWRWIVVAAMLLFIVVPMLLLPVWVKLTGKECALRCVFLQRVEIDGTGALKVTCFHPETLEETAAYRASAGELTNVDVRHNMLVADYGNWRVIVPPDEYAPSDVEALLSLFLQRDMMGN